ncbi:MAG TPA: YidC/Oxa1 family membrane protein insertase, partial [Ktedonobacteraceae bacterium]|nr:YidC/Oxa1 family membrane protein insertase [Ktedonobacteraceae bacterium]
MGQIGYFFNIIFTFPIFNALMVLYRIIGDFGLSIIVLTLVIKLILFPLTLKQLKSMKATQALQPQMAEIRKKYAKDQLAQSRAMQDLYKEYGISPLAGSCLPLLVQMPVLFGLFYALSAVLRSAKTVGDINKLLYPFIPAFSKFPNINLTWFTFINHAWQISLGLPDPTHILPVLAAIATFIQVRMSQPKTMATATDAMSQQMKIMQFISPVMVLFFGWNYAAGLALYWTVSSLFAMFQQYFVTGWGSLLVAPNLISNKTNNNSNSTKAVSSSKAVVVDADESETSDALNGRAKTNGYTSNSSSARRRTR